MGGGEEGAQEKENHSGAEPARHRFEQCAGRTPEQSLSVPRRNAPSLGRTGGERKVGKSTEWVGSREGRERLFDAERVFVKPSR